MSFKLSNLAKVEKSIDVRENDKDVQEIDTHLAEVLRLIDPFNFSPTVHFAQRIDITNSWTTLEPLRRREDKLAKRFKTQNIQALIDVFYNIQI